jgi:ArsR family transcriptional regulator
MGSTEPRNRRLSARIPTTSRTGSGISTDPKRLMILQALRSAERSVGDLAEMVGISLPNASQHLSVMRHSGLVATRRDGTTVFYSLAEPRIAQACDIVHQIALERMR